MTIPPRLKKWNRIMVIAPSLSLWNKRISDWIKSLADERLSNLWLDISFGKHSNEIDFFNSSSIQSRVNDIHEAFSDEKIDWIITAIWWFNSNQLLPYLDFDLIKNNPKILCGYSDITVLQNAILAKTWLVTYSWPHYFNFWEKKWFDYTLDYFKKSLFIDNSYELIASAFWSDDRWARDQENRNFYPHEWYRVLQSWKAEWTLRGWNLWSLRLLQWTEYFPNIDSWILLIEECMPCDALEFDRQLESLLQSIRWNISWLVIGKFEQEAKIDKIKLEYIIRNKPQLKNIPIIANVNIGHVYPFATIPIWGKIMLNLIDNNYSIRIG